MQNRLLENPEVGRVIQGTGGMRKLRVALEGRGRRGGARVIYYRLVDRQQILLLLIYDKSRADDLTAEQKRALRALVEEETLSETIDKEK